MVKVAVVLFAAAAFFLLIQFAGSSRSHSEPPIATADTSVSNTAPAPDVQGRPALVQSLPVSTPAATPPAATPAAPVVIVQATPAATVDPLNDVIRQQLLTYARDNARLADLERQADSHGQKAEELSAKGHFAESSYEGQIQVTYRRQHLDAYKEIQQLKHYFHQLGKARVYPVRDKLLEDVKTPSEYRTWLFELDLF